MKNTSYFLTLLLATLVLVGCDKHYHACCESTTENEDDNNQDITQTVGPLIYSNFDGMIITTASTVVPPGDSNFLYALVNEAEASTFTTWYFGVGTHWSEQGPISFTYSIHPYITSMVNAPGLSQVLYMGTRANPETGAKAVGIVSGSSGVGERNNGIPKDANGDWAIVSALAVNPIDNQILFASIRAAATNTDDGIYQTVNGGDSWTELTASPDNGGHAILIDPINPFNIYLFGSTNHIDKSLDGGTTWASSANGLTFASDDRITSPIIAADSSIYFLKVSPSSPSLLNLYKSADGGASWSEVFSNIGGYTASDFDLNSIFFTKNIAIHPLDTNIVYLAAGNKLFRSLDGGGNWENVATHLQSSGLVPIKYISTDPGNPDVIYVTVNNQLYYFIS